jgi:hypothetical protein
LKRRCRAPQGAGRHQENQLPNQPCSFISTKSIIRLKKPPSLPLHDNQRTLLNGFIIQLKVDSPDHLPLLQRRGKLRLI